MSEAVGSGLLAGRSLDMLEQVVSLVYLPLVTASGQRGGGAPGHMSRPTSAIGRRPLSSRGGERRSVVVQRDELVMSMQKFTTHVSHTLQQVSEHGTRCG